MKRPNIFTCASFLLTLPGCNWISGASLFTAAVQLSDFLQQSKIHFESTSFNLNIVGFFFCTPKDCCIICFFFYWPMYLDSVYSRRQ